MTSGKQIDKKLTAVIVDDERLARNVMKSNLSEFPEVSVVGEAHNVSSAIEVITDTKPNVVFLDIQMPGESGFDLLEKIDHTFRVIFVTAHDKYAIRAFEVNALDYIMKPVKKSRLKNTIERLLDGSKVAVEHIKPTYDDKLILTVEGRVKLVPIKNIIKICADKDYSCVSTLTEDKLRTLKTMVAWEKKLPGENFARIHRSTIINLERLERIEKIENHNYKIYLRNMKEPVVMSRRYAYLFKNKMKF